MADRSKTVNKFKDTYLVSLNLIKKIEATTIAVWWEPGQMELECWRIPLPLPPNTKGFTSAGQGRIQYNIPQGVLSPDATRSRPCAYRIPFMLNAAFEDKDITVSHLCHHNWCHNPAHAVLESLATNKARNGCPGGAHCHHQTRCLRPGPHYAN